MDKRKRSPWKLPKSFHMDIVHEIKGGEHKPVAPHRKVPDAWGKPAEVAAAGAGAGASLPPLGLLEFTTQGLRGTLRAVRGDGVLEVALPFGQGFLQPRALLLGQGVACPGGVQGVLEAVREDGFLEVRLPFGQGIIHLSSLAVKPS